MTLEQYLNQDNPVRHPMVLLQEGEYRTWRGHTIKGEPSKKAVVYVFPEYDYVLLGTRLWTTDDDGNPLKPSVFVVPKTELR